jgi:phage tail protein X
VTFWIEPAKRTATVNYLSTNSQAREILSAHLGLADAATAFPRELQVSLRQSAPDVTEGVVPLSQVELFYRALFGLMGMLGHAVYL